MLVKLLLQMHPPSGCSNLLAMLLLHAQQGPPLVSVHSIVLKRAYRITDPNIPVDLSSDLAHSTHHQLCTEFAKNLGTISGIQAASITVATCAYARLVSTTSENTTHAGFVATRTEEGCSCTSWPLP